MHGTGTLVTQSELSALPAELAVAAPGVVSADNLQITRMNIYINLYAVKRMSQAPQASPKRPMQCMQSHWNERSWH